MTINSKFKSYRIVPLEDRIVLDAEIAQEANDLMDIELFDALVDELAEVNTLAQGENTKVLLLASGVENPNTFYEEGKKLEDAVSDDTLLLTYDSSHVDYEGLLEAIKSKTHGKIDHLALANHGGEGFFNLFDGATVSLAALTANDGQNAMVSFWKDLSALMSEDGRIDLLACRVTADNQLLIDHLEELSGVNFAASSNSTGLGGDWLLETDNVEVSSLYFNEAELLNWQGSLENFDEQNLIGTWKIKSEAGAVGVGPSQGETYWWSNSAEDVTTRATFFDDSYIFNANGSFQNILDGTTWLETWQGVDFEQAGAPVAPHDGSNLATYVLDGNQMTITGVGAYLGLAKFINGGELASPADAPDSITYTVSDLTDDNMVLDINFGPGWWRFEFEKEPEFAQMTGVFGGLTVDGDVYTFPSGAEGWAGVANDNTDIYPLTFTEAGTITFDASVPPDEDGGDGGEVNVYFRFEYNPYPNVDPFFDTANVTISGADLASYTVNVPAQGENTFSSFLMYIVERDIPVQVTNFVISADDVVDDDGDGAVDDDGDGVVFDEVDLLGSWSLYPGVEAVKFGPSLDSLIADLSNTAASGFSPFDLLVNVFDDKFQFNVDGSFQDVLGSTTFVEDWQNGVEALIGEPVAPHDGSTLATFTFNSDTRELTIDGVGAYLGSPAFANDMLLTSPQDAPDSITYDVSELTPDSLVVSLQFPSPYDDGSLWSAQFSFLKVLAVDSIDDGDDDGAGVGTDLFFSEYAEGSSNNKYLEIYNPTSAAVSLDGYAYPSVANAPGVVGQYEFWNPFDEGAVIAAGDVYIVAHPIADEAILAEADEIYGYLSNGDDGFALVKGTEEDYEIIDWIGDFQGDPGSGWDVAGVSAATKDHTLVRKPSVTSGNTDWTASAGTDAEDSEWVVSGQNEWSNLGLHDVESPVISTFAPDMTGVFDGFIGDGQYFIFPSDAEEWAGVANTDTSIYPLTFTDDGNITFKASVRDGSDVNVYFRFEYNVYPDTEPFFNTVPVMISGSVLTEYTIEVPTQGENTFSSFLMYIVGRDTPVQIMDITIKADPVEVSDPIDFDGYAFTEELVENPANNELQDYVSGLASVNSEGEMVLRIERGEDDDIEGPQFDSSRINTMGADTLQLNDGQKLSIEFTATLPQAKDANGDAVEDAAVWPALWLMGDDRDSNGNWVGWPYVGEIDVMEYSPTKALNEFSVAAHWNNGADYSPDYVSTSISSSNILNAGQKFRVEISRFDDDTPSTIEYFYNDGADPIFTVVENENNQELWRPVDASGTIQGGTKNYFMIMNIAMGGDYTGITDPNLVPADFDYAEMVISDISVTVEDAAAPEVSVNDIAFLLPAGIPLTNDEIEESTQLAYSDLVTSMENLIYSFEDSVIEFYENKEVFTRTHSFEDEAGNIGTAEQLVTVYTVPREGDTVFIEEAAAVSKLGINRGAFNNEFEPLTFSKPVPYLISDHFLSSTLNFTQDDPLLSGDRYELRYQLQFYDEDGSFTLSEDFDDWVLLEVTKMSSRDIPVESEESIQIHQDYVWDTPSVGSFEFGSGGWFNLEVTFLDWGVGAGSDGDKYPMFGFSNEIIENENIEENIEEVMGEMQAFEDAEFDVDSATGTSWGVLAALEDVSLYFSQVAVTGEQVQYLEIANPMPVDIELDDYALWIGDARIDFLDDQIIKGKSNYIIASSDAEEEVKSLADIILNINLTTDQSYNFLDPYENPLDSIAAGFDLSWDNSRLEDYTLFRKVSTQVGNDSWSTSSGITADDSEWVKGAYSTMHLDAEYSSTFPSRSNSENFDSFVEDSDITNDVNWVTWSGQENEKAYVVYDEELESMVLEVASGNDVVFLLSDQPYSSGLVEITFDFKAGEGLYFNIQGTATPGEVFNSQILLGQFSDWQTLKYVMNLDTQTAELYIDDQLNRNVDLNGNSVQGINFYGVFSSSCFIDNLSVTQPLIVDEVLAYEGASNTYVITRKGGLEEIADWFADFIPGSSDYQFSFSNYDSESDSVTVTVDFIEDGESEGSEDIPIKFKSAASGETLFEISATIRDFDYDRDGISDEVEYDSYNTLDSIGRPERVVLIASQDPEILATFFVVDQSPSDKYTIEITGGEDSDFFKIEGSQLLAKKTLTPDQSYELEVIVTDQQGNSYTQDLIYMQLIESSIKLHALGVEDVSSNVGVPEVIGSTTYDYQTNGNMSGRSIVTSNGNVLYAYIKSDDVDLSGRGTGVAVYENNEWTSLSSTIEGDGLRTGWSSFAVLPSGTKVVTAHTGTGLVTFSQAPGSDVWEQVNETNDNQTWARMVAVDGTLVRIATIDSGSQPLVISTSGDGGYTWTDPETLLSSEDGRLSSTQVDSVVMKVVDGVVYAGYFDYEFSALFKSEDEGKTWETIWEDNSVLNLILNQLDKDLNGDGIEDVVTGSPLIADFVVTVDGEIFLFTERLALTRGSSLIDDRLGVSVARLDLEMGDVYTPNISGSLEKSGYGILFEAPEVPFTGGYSTSTVINSISAMIDSEGGIFVAFSILDETGFRQVYLTASPDGTNWSEPVAVGESDMENAFVNIVQVTDETIQVVYQRDEFAGTSVLGWHSRGESEILALEIDKSLFEDFFAKFAESEEVAAAEIFAMAQSNFSLVDSNEASESVSINTLTAYKGAVMAVTQVAGSISENSTPSASVKSVVTAPTSNSDSKMHVLIQPSTSSDLPQKGSSSSGTGDAEEIVVEATTDGGGDAEGGDATDGGGDAEGGDATDGGGDAGGGGTPDGGGDAGGGGTPDGGGDTGGGDNSGEVSPDTP